jgi:D-tyrosyl-tRNA(Tyr) deacylase
MLACVQRVAWAQVQVGESVIGRIWRGLLVYVGIAPADDPDLAGQMARKVVTLRIFPDPQGKLNLSVQDIRGGVLVVPNFTLMADTRKGRRPAFDGAAGADAARPIHDALVAALKNTGVQTESGSFGADMTILSAADGPVNVLLQLPPGGGEET